MKYKKIYSVIVITILLVAPWFNIDSTNNYSIPKVSQEDTSFFEINPCKISLTQFLISNPESIYQNHFYFRSDNRSSIECFGRISGVTVLQKGLETQFFISVGTSSLVNLLLQGLIWTILFSFIPKNKINKNVKESLKYKNLIILLISYFLTFSIYAESRFYENNMYLLDLSKFSSYLLIYLIFVLIVKNLTDVFSTRSENFSNYLPYVYIVTGLFSGFNLSFLSVVFLYYGFNSNLIGIKNKLFNNCYLILSVWWLFNSRGSAFFNVGKLRGFTSSIFEFNANLFWIIFFYFMIIGIWRIYLLNCKTFDLSLFTTNLSITSLVLLVSGVLSANFPIFNFITYYFFGLQRYGVESKTPFAFDEYSVKISWRGLFPSSETIGEFYGLCLLFLLFYIFTSKKVTIIKYFGIFASSLGLYFSDNRTAIILIFIFTLSYPFLKEDNNLNIKKSKIIVSSLSISTIILIYFRSADNALSGYKFMSESLLSKTYTFQEYYSTSSFSNLVTNFESSSLISAMFGFFSVLAYILNRSEMWGLFIARYNPTFFESIFGSSPLNFGQLYGEVSVKEADSFLLPHSSLLSYIVFIGIVPIIILLYRFVRDLYLRRTNREFLLFSVYVFINVLKNDSLNYFSPFIFYGIIYLILREIGTISPTKRLSKK